MEEPVIVVSGLPRCGTSMLMQMLEAGGIPVLTDGVRRPDSNNPRGYYEDERVKRLHKKIDKAWLAEAQGKALKVISFLLQHLPDTRSYRILFMQRPLREIIASQNRMLSQSASECGNEADERLLRSYEVHLAGVRSMHAKRPEVTTLSVNHRDVLTHPQEEAVRIARFLERDLDTARMAAVVDSQLYRNRGE